MQVANTLLWAPPMKSHLLAFEEWRLEAEISHKYLKTWINKTKTLSMARHHQVLLGKLEHFFLFWTDPLNLLSLRIWPHFILIQLHFRLLNSNQGAHRQYLMNIFLSFSPTDLKIFFLHCQMSLHIRTPPHHPSLTATPIQSPSRLLNDHPPPAPTIPRPCSPTSLC